MNLKEAREITLSYIREYTGKEPGTNGERNTTQYDVDKGSVHSFIDTYEHYFSKYQDKPINFLEIGISGGWSLHMWKTYFHQDSQIFGIDIDPLNLTWHEGRDKVKMIFSDINDTQTIMSEIKDTTFDIIIDDASHTIQDQYNTYQTMIQKVNKGGLYIIEDFDKLEQNIIHFLPYSPKVVDLRNVKGRYDDVLVIFEKN